MPLKEFSCKQCGNCCLNLSGAFSTCADEKDIEIIKSPVGMPGRAIFSSFIQKVKDGKRQPKKCLFKCIKTCDIDTSPYCIIIALINALKGNFENGFAFAGSNAFRATKISSVKAIFQSLLSEYKESKRDVSDCS